MKKVKLFFFVLMSVAVIGLVSCKKDNDDNSNPATGGGSVTLKADGVSWNASLGVQGINSNGVINVTGSDSNAHQASVILYNVSAPGTYEVGGLGNSNMLRWTVGLGQNDSYIANGVIGSGTITVTELSATHVKGTFSFTGFNTAQTSMSITEGTFDATF